MSGSRANFTRRQGALRKFRFIFSLLFILGMIESFHSESQSLKMQLYEVMRSVHPEGLPGAAIVVLRNDSLLISDGFGISRLPDGHKITENTNFRMASVSKQFTAFCILLLAHEHRLKIEDPITKYLSELPPFASAVTIKHLMTHSSGLQDYEGLIPDSTTLQISDKDVLRLLQGTDSLYFKPGTKFQYSNTGYCIMTQIIERVSGIQYPDFIRQKIFTPIAMLNTSIMQQGDSIIHRAYGYHQEGNDWAFADQSITSATMGDGCVYTSVNDYIKWIRTLWAKKLLEPDRDDDPLHVHMPISKTLQYGHGWFTCQLPGDKRAFFHSGESTGFHNIVFQQPERKLLIAIFSNADDSRITTAFDKVAGVLQVDWPGKEKGVSLFDLIHQQYE